MRRTDRQSAVSDYFQNGGGKQEPRTQPVSGKRRRGGPPRGGANQAKLSAFLTVPVQEDDDLNIPGIGADYPCNCPAQCIGGQPESTIQAGIRINSQGLRVLECRLTRIPDRDGCRLRLILDEAVGVFRRPEDLGDAYGVRFPMADRPACACGFYCVLARHQDGWSDFSGCLYFSCPGKAWPCTSIYWEEPPEGPVCVCTVPSVLGFRTPLGTVWTCSLRRNGSLDPEGCDFRQNSRSAPLTRPRNALEIQAVCPGEAT